MLSWIGLLLTLAVALYIIWKPRKRHSLDQKDSRFIRSVPRMIYSKTDDTRAFDISYLLSKRAKSSRQKE